MSEDTIIYKNDGRNISIHTKVDVALNEPLVNNVMNRSLRELVLNDSALYELNRLIFSKANITDYIPGMAYKAGDLVWFKDINNKLFLLKCIRLGNTLMPDTTSKDIATALSESGWEDQNSSLTILDYHIMDLVDAKSQLVVNEHEINDEYHPYGKVSLDENSENHLSKKLLKQDMSNLDYSRLKVFFPLRMKALDSGYAIINGYSRQYDDKLVEYDIVLKLASSTIVESKQLFDSYQELSANNVVFKIFSGLSLSSIDFQTNRSYFFNTNDMDIFQDKESPYSSRCGLIVQLLRNDFVNTYSALVSFPVPFIDNNYMVFSNSILSLTISDKEIVPSANDLTFCNKTRQGITFLDITFPDATKYGNTGYNAKNGGLIANSFHCKVIGRIGV